MSDTFGEIPAALTLTYPTHRHGCTSPKDEGLTDSMALSVVPVAPCFVHGGRFPLVGERWVRGAAKRSDC